MVTVGTGLLPVLRDDRSLPQEVLQTGAMATKRVIRGHEPEHRKCELCSDTTLLNESWQQTARINMTTTSTTVALLMWNQSDLNDPSVSLTKWAGLPYLSFTNEYMRSRSSTNFFHSGFSLARSL